MNAYEETYRSHTITIHTDEHAQSPSEWQDESLFLVHYHRSFQVESDYVTSEDLREYFTVKNRQYEKREDIEPDHFLNDYHIFVVAALIHSGVWLKLSSGGFAEDSSGWDTSHCGFVLAGKEEWPDENKAHKAAESFVEEWNDYLSGNVYGYTIAGDICDDSCWGFYGDYNKYCLVEAISAVDFAIKYVQTEHCKRLKSWIQAKVGLLYRSPMPV